MLKVLDTDKVPVSWRSSDPAVLETLSSLGPNQVATDGRSYKDRYAAHKAAMAFRELLRRRRPDLRMRCRIARLGGSYRWFARVEPRTPRGLE